MLLIGLLIALRRRRYEFLVFAAPAFGTVMLYALFTQFIPRYGAPALSMAIVTLVVSVYYVLRAEALPRVSET